MDGSYQERKMILSTVPFWELWVVKSFKKDNDFHGWETLTEIWQVHSRDNHPLCFLKLIISNGRSCCFQRDKKKELRSVICCKQKTDTDKITLTDMQVEQSDVTPRYCMIIKQNALTLNCCWTLTWSRSLQKKERGEEWKEKVRHNVTVV